ncbi:hypothetical protein CTI12_AA396630 [Artemisia annua]|uniref:Uncharacterized protein n=1 Tax=Artemisia annua TaxID=35608 RepID=A0A2U1MCA0_ARTAN|nr:hypothetical protein CTI12_AA396630 [Artemisia annua]
MGSFLDREVEDEGILCVELDKLESEPEELPSPAVSKSVSTMDGDLTKMKNVNVGKSKEEDDEEKAKIVKELKELKRQNFITQCLLSAMIVLTITWQISEVSIILKLKDGVTHPFRSIGGLFMSMIRPSKAIGNDEDTDPLISSNLTSNLIESSPVNDLKIPELPRIELPNIDFRLNLED